MMNYEKKGENLKKKMDEMFEVTSHMYFQPVLNVTDWFSGPPLRRLWRPWELMAWERMANPYRSLSCAGNLRIELLHIARSTAHDVLKFKSAEANPI